MTNQPYSEQTIGNLTRAQLEEIIKAITKRTIQQEMIATGQNKSQYAAETFGAWEDERTDEEIIKEIYDNRNSNLTLT
ncbi:hypothetical protein IQ247_17285 [Plectonema cf. radiosum LEGE 06105]|uniref:Uncharacterized protein n=1 Tax=Plectonema cf. radiosum LEGE 06105 TaxID=945769 RepID=A0A8J7F5T5_9CYAN|nr:hypothetical protein [Plectonema radiosum]MBE9214400.1 hypothetical protein [Plectonema cf. radiosum LEGE 06105]